MPLSVSARSSPAHKTRLTAAIDTEDGPEDLPTLVALLLRVARVVAVQTVLDREVGRDANDGIGVHARKVAERVDGVKQDARDACLRV